MRKSDEANSVTIPIDKKVVQKHGNESCIFPEEIHTFPFFKSLRKGEEWVGKHEVRLEIPYHLGKGKTVYSVIFTEANTHIDLQVLAQIPGFIWETNANNFAINNIHTQAQNVFALFSPIKFFKTAYTLDMDYSQPNVTVKRSSHLNALAAILAYEIKNNANNAIVELKNGKSSSSIRDRDLKISFLCAMPEVVIDAIQYAIDHLSDMECVKFATELMKNNDAQRVLINYFFNSKNPHHCNDDHPVVQRLQKQLLPVAMRDFPVQMNLMLNTDNHVRKLKEISDLLSVNRESSETLQSVNPADQLECERYLKMINDHDKTGYADVLLARYFLSSSTHLSDKDQALSYALSGLKKAATSGDPQAYDWLIKRIPLELKIADWDVFKSISYLQTTNNDELKIIEVLQNFYLQRETHAESVGFKTSYLNYLLSLYPTYQSVMLNKNLTPLQRKINELIQDALQWHQQYDLNEPSVDYLKLFAEDMKLNSELWIKVLNQGLTGIDPLYMMPAVEKLMNSSSQLNPISRSTLNLMLQQLIYKASVQYEMAVNAFNADQNQGLKKSENLLLVNLRTQLGKLLKFLEKQPEYFIAMKFAKDKGYKDKGKGLWNISLKREIDNINSALEANPDNFAAHLQASEYYSRSNERFPHLAVMIFLVQKKLPHQYVGDITPEQCAQKSESDLREIFNKAAKSDDRIRAGIALVRAQVMEANHLLIEMVRDLKLKKEYFERVVKQSENYLPLGMRVADCNPLFDAAVTVVASEIEPFAAANKKEHEGQFKKVSSSGALFFKDGKSNQPGTSDTAENFGVSKKVGKTAKDKNLNLSDDEGSTAESFRPHFALIDDKLIPLSYSNNYPNLDSEMSTSVQPISSYVDSSESESKLLEVLSNLSEKSATRVLFVFLRNNPKLAIQLQKLGVLKSEASESPISLTKTLNSNF